MSEKAITALAEHRAKVALEGFVIALIVRYIQ